MYYCWRHHNIKPIDFYNMSEGDKTVIRAFYEIEMEERKETAEATAKAGMCPALALI